MLKEISDVALTAYLTLKGYKQIKPPKVKGGIVIFTFDDPNNKIATETIRFFNRDTQVDALELVELVRNFKSQVSILKRNAVSEVSNE